MTIIRDRSRSVYLGEYFARPLFAHFAIALDPTRAARLLTRCLAADRATWEPRFRETLHDAENVLICFVPETVVGP